MTVGDIYNYLDGTATIYVTQGDLIKYRYMAKDLMPMHLKDCYIDKISGGEDETGEYISIELLY